MKPDYEPEPFPLELVASIAAQLLEGENYEEAVGKARILMGLSSFTMEEGG